MQNTQEQAIVTPRSFLTDLETNDEVKAWTREILSRERNSSASHISREDVMKGIKAEQERIRKTEEERRQSVTRPLDAFEMPTLYDLPAISKGPDLTINKLPTQVLDDPASEFSA